MLLKFKIELNEYIAREISLNIINFSYKFFYNYTLSNWEHINELKKIVHFDLKPNFSSTPTQKRNGKENSHDVCNAII